MARARLRVCAHPGCPTMTPRTLCQTHQAERDRHQRASTPTKTVRNREKSRRAHVVADHRDRHGDWCPGWGRPAHHATDLTADDIDPVAVTGRPSTHLRVLCRSCNSRRGAHTRRTLEAATLATPDLRKPPTTHP